MENHRMQRHPLIVPLTSADATAVDRFGPKAANLARLGRAGLPIPGGFCIDAEAYRIQIAALGLADSASDVSSADLATARRGALAMKLGLYDRPIVQQLLDPLLVAWRALVATTGALTVVRSSALVEDRFGSSFAGQFESYLGLEDETDFVTAVRSCWAALWSTRVLRYMATHDASPADTAMAVLVQPLVSAGVAGGGLSRTADGDMVLNATWGLGSAIAQGEVVPDRIVFGRDKQGELTLRETVLGRKFHRVGCAHGTRPLHLEPAPVPDEIWLRHPGLKGQPAGVGWGSGRACVINCECELARVAPGDILVTRVAGPALSQVLPRVAGVVAELGGSTSHLASLARERGIPMVLGVLDATQRIPDGAQVAVDGMAGVVRWMR